MSDIDHGLLPARCLVDTGVLIRALSQFDDKQAAVCRDFFDAMVACGKQMLLAAPVIAEVLRGRPQPLPRTKSLIPVAFDSRAAEILGLEIPVAVLRSESPKSGHSRTYLKYDAMIVACAKRWAAECIVALDDDHGVLAHYVEIPVRHPRDFLCKQPNP
jgi:predicted nucleic acid-binding protein